VRALSLAAARGVVRLGARNLPCALGRSGRRAMKREADGATPLGCWRLVRVFYRPDRLRRPSTCLPVAPLRPSDGWCDAAADRNYNRRVTHPYPASAERLWRADALYDVLVVLDYNLRPRVKGRGSAIFLHLARPGHAPTEGCIALARRDLLRLLQSAGPGARLRLRP
jgi:L,D-peptidoglycan transpeptidase YkuD (ErfK/YbiS/YcfS/YnhG family)